LLKPQNNHPKKKGLAILELEAIAKQRIKYHPGFGKETPEVIPSGELIDVKESVGRVQDSRENSESPMTNPLLRRKEK